MGRSCLQKRDHCTLQIIKNNYIPYGSYGVRLVTATFVQRRKFFEIYITLDAGFETSFEHFLVDDLGRACLTDFGLSSISDSKIPAWTSHSSVGSKGGSIRWQAPELFDPDSDQVVKNSVASDVYALSCVFFEIFTGTVPFAHISLDYTIMLQVKSGARPARPSDSSPSWGPWGLTENIWSLMQACWEADPVKRPTLDDANARMTMEIPFDSRSASGGSTLSPARFRKRLGKKFNIMSVSTLESLLHHDGDGSPTVQGTKSKFKRLFRMF